MSNVRTTGGLIAALILSLMLWSAAVKAQGGDANIEYRQKIMTTNGQNMGAIGDILKNQLPLQGNIAEHARILSINAKMIPGAFKAQAAEGKTDAKADIWKDWSAFEAKAKKLQEESDKLAQVAAGGNMAEIGEQIKKVGGACKACHDDFRKPKEQSYKNK